MPTVPLCQREPSSRTTRPFSTMPPTQVNRTSACSTARAVWVGASLGLAAPGPLLLELLPWSRASAIPAHKEDRGVPSAPRAGAPGPQGPAYSPASCVRAPPLRAPTQGRGQGGGPLAWPCGDRMASRYTTCPSLELSLATLGHFPSRLIQITWSQLWGRPGLVSVAGCEGGQARGKVPSPRAWPSVPRAGLASTLQGAAPLEPLSAQLRALQQPAWKGRVAVREWSLRWAPGGRDGHCPSAAGIPGPGALHPIMDTRHTQ